MSIYYYLITYVELIIWNFEQVRPQCSTCRTWGGALLISNGLGFILIALPRRAALPDFPLLRVGLPSTRSSLRLLPRLFTRLAFGPIRAVRIVDMGTLLTTSKSWSLLHIIDFFGGSPGKFDSRTLNRKTLNRWTGRIDI